MNIRNFIFSLHLKKANLTKLDSKNTITQCRAHCKMLVCLVSQERSNLLIGKSG